MPQQDSQKYVISTRGGLKAILAMFEMDDGSLGISLVPNGGAVQGLNSNGEEDALKSQRWSIHPSDHVESHCDVTFSQDSGESSQQSKIMSADLKNGRSLIVFSKRFSSFSSSQKRKKLKNFTVIDTYDPKKSFLTIHVAVRPRGSKDEPLETRKFRRRIKKFSRFELMVYWRFWPLPALPSIQVFTTYYPEDDATRYNEFGDAVGFLGSGNVVNSLEDLDLYLLSQFCNEDSLNFVDVRQARALLFTYATKSGSFTKKRMPSRSPEHIALLNQMECLQLK